LSVALTVKNIVALLNANTIKV